MLDAQLLGDAKKSPRKRARGGDDEEDGDGAGDLDVRMMTTMIHRALAAPFITAPPVRIRPNSDIYIDIDIDIDVDTPQIVI